MTEFVEGQKVYTWDYTITPHTIKGIDIVDGRPKYWLDEMFGYYSKDDLFTTKNEVIDHLITVLERMKDA